MATAGCLLAFGALFGPESAQAPQRTLQTDWNDAIDAGTDGFVVIPFENGEVGSMYNIQIPFPDEIKSDLRVDEVSPARYCALFDGMMICPSGVALPPGVRRVALADGQIYDGNAALIIPDIELKDKVVLGIPVYTYLLRATEAITGDEDYAVLVYPLHNPEDGSIAYHFHIYGIALKGALA